MSEPIKLYHRATGELLISYAPTTAAGMVSSGEYAYTPPAEPLTPSPPPETPIPLFMMNKAELLAEASRRGIGVDPKWKKSQIADVLAAADEL